jgi:hypothetical protein
VLKRPGDRPGRADPGIGRAQDGPGGAHVGGCIYVGGRDALGQFGEAERDAGTGARAGFSNRTMSTGWCPASAASAASSRQSAWPATSWLLAVADTVIREAGPEALSTLSLPTLRARFLWKPSWRDHSDHPHLCWHAWLPGLVRAALAEAVKVAFVIGEGGPPAPGSPARRVRELHAAGGQLLVGFCMSSQVNSTGDSEPSLLASNVRLYRTRVTALCGGRTSSSARRWAPPRWARR